MDSRKQVILFLLSGLILVAMGILSKRVGHCVPGLYICHETAGAAFLLSLVTWILPSTPQRSHG
ncbi:MAG: hypothetical protein HYU36_01140 [Planctomycetes bacterium]|nr:hypothetical protein [Planctomycetota bacterium]